MGRPPVYVGCRVEDCDNPHAARGYCNRHYKREISRAGATRRRQPIQLEDVEWMAETGEVWERAAQRLDVKEGTLLRYLERAHRYDLIRKLQRRVTA